ncbi:MAG: DUF1700 domain-containing protein [Acholeplasmataceae bacterium]|nr:DUF1700 domain-containing protein [Acholeplasmataceae bacterium]
MNKITFIQELEKGLKKIGVSDFTDIIKDYETHFDNELNKGKSEEEIAKELGSIPDILSDFQAEEKQVVSKKKMNYFQVIFNEVFGYLGLFILYLFNLSLISLSISSVVLGIYLMTSLSIFSFIPDLVSPFSQFTGFTFVILSVFTFVLSIMLFRLLNQMTLRLIQWHHEMLSGKVYEEKEVKQSKLMIRIAQISGIALVILLIVTYIVGVVITKEAEFWHYWNWFS